MPNDANVMDSADIAGGIAADDAAAGDAAVLALVTGKCAPAVSKDSICLPEKIRHSECISEELPESSPTASTGLAQYFNIWESDPDNEEADKVHSWLRRLGLGRYFEQLSAEGFDDMNILANLEEKQICELMEACPMPMLHEQQLRRGLSRLRTDGTTPDLPPLPPV